MGGARRVVDRAWARPTAGRKPRNILGETRQSWDLELFNVEWLMVSVLLIVYFRKDGKRARGTCRKGKGHSVH